MEYILKRYNKPFTAIVVTGDILDRGFRFNAQKCLDLLIKTKLSTGNIYILQTNHLNYHYKRYMPADWWYVRQEHYQEYIKLFDQLPYAVISSNGIIGIHGFPPTNLLNNRDIRTGENDWLSINWGRFSDDNVDQNFIDKTLASNKSKIIIRTHDHYIDRYTFNHKVLTFTTSKNLPDTKCLIAAIDITKHINDVRDIKLVDIDLESSNL